MAPFLIALVKVAVVYTKTLHDLAAEVTGSIIPKPPNLVGSENNLHSEELTSHLNKIGKNRENIVDSKSRKELSQLQTTC